MTGQPTDEQPRPRRRRPRGPVLITRGPDGRILRLPITGPGLEETPLDDPDMRALLNAIDREETR